MGEYGSVLSILAGRKGREKKKLHLEAGRGKCWSQKTPPTQKKKSLKGSKESEKDAAGSLQ